ncbi:MAG TPA: hypothetical protein VHQ87_11255, partial [Rhizobacter sp.]|nr:hypothetical protein [Rhizobacter sp.]
MRLFKHAQAELAVSSGLALVCWLAFAIGWPTGLRLWIWAALVHGTQAMLGGLIWHFKQAGRAALAQAPRWLQGYLAVILLSGVAWGLAPWFLLSDLPFLPTPYPALALVLLLLALAAAGAHTAATHRWAIYLWLLPLLAPLVVFMLNVGTLDAVIVAALVLAFLAACVFFAHARHRLLMKELQTKLDNDAL